MRREHIPRQLVPVARVPARTRSCIAETDEMHHLNEKGTTVKSTEQTAKPIVTPNTGLFATLRGLFRLKGSGAPESEALTMREPSGMAAAPRRHAARAGVPVLALLATLGVVGFASAPALAAAPEAPETNSPAKAITATTATLEGVLNPHALAKAGWYFAYSTELMCLVGAHTTAVQPEEEVKAKLESIEVTGLQPSKKYTFCMFATDEAGEATPSANEVSFETSALAPEVVPGSEEASGVNQHEAHLGATVNANNQEVTECQFLYGTKASLATSTATACEQATLPGVYGGQVVGLNVSGLAQQTTYYFRVVVENIAHEKTEGPIVHFTTPPETPETLPASTVAITTATLNGVLSPAGTVAGEPGTSEFRYRQSASQCQGGEVGEEKATPTTPASGSAKDAVNAPVTGLLNGTQYTFCLLEHNSAGAVAIGPAVTFMTHGAGITEEQALGIETGAATLQASIDPNESNTSYHFEYDTSPYTSGASHGTSLPAPSEAIGAGTTPESVRVRLSGLRSGTTYHYRVVATDEIETFYGTDKIFTTPATAGSEPPQNCSNEQRRAEQPYGLRLPDCRAYELVSPLETLGNDATDPFTGNSRAAVSGEAVAYVSRGTFAEPKGSNVENEYISRRGPGGWSTEDVTPLHNPTRTEAVPSYGANAFTPELTEGITATNGKLTGEAPEGVFGLYVADFASGSYQYVGHEGPAFYPVPLGASADLGHVLTWEQGPAPKVKEWANGKVMPVNVANNGENINAAVGATSSVELGAGRTDKWHAISADGSRVFFTSPPYFGDASYPPYVANAPQLLTLYVRVNVEQPQSPMNGDECTVATDACTIEVSASQRAVPDPHAPQGARYWGASADGSRVFFTSLAELTENAYTGPEDNAPNLYEYELSGQPGVPGQLTDLSVDDSGNGAGVLGVTQISEDGSYVYFVAEDALTADAAVGAPNLYVSHDGGAPRFIATLAASDLEDWGGGRVGTEGGPNTNSAVLSPSGARFAFASQRSLTGYDNEQAEPGECEGRVEEFIRQTGGRCNELYLYDAETKSLACASCNPTGARPVGSSSFRPAPGLTLAEYRQRDLMESGTLFFDSSDALVPHTSDGRQNVYEYVGGHVRAISDVAGGSASFFMDASANGDNVFFASADQLLPQDTSNNVVVYDARIDGGFPVVGSPPPCDNGDSCKAPPTPQPAAFGLPASATFSGKGNLPPASVAPPESKGKAVAHRKVTGLAKALRACRSERKARRVRCEKQARKRYSAHTHGVVRKSGRRSVGR